MEFRYRALAVLMIILALAVLFLAGLNRMSFGLNEKKDQGVLEKETIYFWYSDSTLTDYVSASAVLFGEQEGVRIIPVLVSDSEYLEAIHSASMDMGQVPDLYMLSNDALEKAYLTGLAVEIQDPEQLCNEDFYPRTALDAVNYQNKKIAYPYYYETSAFLYNKTYLGDDWKVPGTFDELLTFADTYEPPENVEAILKWDVSDIFYNYFFVGNYLEVGGDTGDQKSMLDIDNEETRRCLDIYQNLNQFFFIEPDQVSYSSVIQDFMQGKIVFTVATTDVLKTLAQAKTEGTFAYDYGVSLIPQPSSELQGRSLSVTSCVAVNGYSVHKELANSFASFLVSGYHDSLYEKTGKVSAMLYANENSPELTVFMEEYKNSKSLPKMMETSNFWIQLEILFSKVWLGEDSAELLKQLSTQIHSQIN